MGSQAQRIEGNSLVLLQVNCRSILKKSLDFWNLVDTDSPGVIICLERKLAMLMYLGTITQLSGETEILEVVECLFV
jgi:hypothetical protein